MGASAVLRLLLPLHLSRAYWPTGFGGFESSCSAQQRGPQSLLPPVSSAALAYCPFGPPKCSALLVDASGTVLVVGSSLQAFNGATLAPAWSLNSSGAAWLQGDGTIFVAGVGLLVASSGQLLASFTQAAFFASRVGDYVLGGSTCPQPPSDPYHDCFALTTLSGEARWRADPGEFTTVDWLFNTGDEVVLRSCSSCPGPECAVACGLLALRPTDPTYQPFLPGPPSGGPSILQAMASPAGFAVLRAPAAAQPVPDWYAPFTLEVYGKVSSAALSLDPGCTPFIALWGSVLYVAGCPALPALPLPFLTAYAIDEAPDQQLAALWRISLAEYGNATFTYMAVDSDGTVFAASESGGIYAFSSAGALASQSPAADVVYHSLAIGDGALYAASESAVHAFLSAPPPPPAPSAPALSLGILLGLGLGGGVAVLSFCVGMLCRLRACPAAEASGAESEEPMLSVNDSTPRFSASGAAPPFLSTAAISFD